MNYEQLAFVNQQLAAMLRAGIPLEGSLRRLCAEMQRGPLRKELEQLEADLAQGLPFQEALAARQLPALYLQMVGAGSQTNDFPAMLTLLADYYQRANSLWTRLKGLMVYPTIVLLTSLVLSVFMAVLFRTLLQSSYFGAGEFWNNDRVSEISPLLLVSLYLPVLVLGLVTCLVVAGLAIPRLRQFLRWRLPGFKESSLSLSASTMRMLLDSGRPLNHALGILQQVENSTPAGADLACWQKRLAAGHAKFSDLALGSRTFPPLFVWLVAQAGEDLATGFGRAAEIYYARAMHRIEMLLYAVLPVSILLLGMLIVGQVLPAFRCFTWMVEPLGDLGGGD